MKENNKVTAADGNGPDLRSVVRGAIEEFMSHQQAKAEPGYKLELLEERKKREQLERRLNELAEEARRSRLAAEEMDRSTSIRNELHRLGVRAEDGRLIARTESGDVSAREYLAKFLTENPELLPGRIQGGSGAGPGQKAPTASAGFDMDKIRPGMSAEDLDRVRQEIARVANQAIRGM